MEEELGFVKSLLFKLKVCLVSSNSESNFLVLW